MHMCVCCTYVCHVCGGMLGHLAGHDGTGMEERVSGYVCEGLRACRYVCALGGVGVSVLCSVGVFQGSACVCVSFGSMCVYATFATLLFCANVHVRCRVCACVRRVCVCA